MGIIENRPIILQVVCAQAGRQGAGVVIKFVWCLIKRKAKNKAAVHGGHGDIAALWCQEAEVGLAIEVLRFRLVGLYCLARQ